jgi:hypothetical protein
MLGHEKPPTGRSLDLMPLLDPECQYIRLGQVGPITEQK